MLRGSGLLRKDTICRNNRKGPRPSLYIVKGNAYEVTTSKSCVPHEARVHSSLASGLEVSSRGKGAQVTKS